MPCTRDVQMAKTVEEGGGFGGYDPCRWRVVAKGKSRTVGVCTNLSISCIKPLESQGDPKIGWGTKPFAKSVEPGLVG
jgi:hypothetical protein